LIPPLPIEMASTDSIPQNTLLCPSCGKTIVAFQMTGKGVCQFCLSRFEKNSHRWALDPTQEELKQHFDEHQPEHGTSIEFDSASDFDWSGVDQLLGELEPLPEDSIAQAAEALSRILVFCWGNRTSLQTALARFTAVSGTLRPDLLDGASFEEIGRQCGLTKQSISRMSLRWCDSLGLKMRRNRPKKSRANMSRSQLGHPSYQRKKADNTGDSKPPVSRVKTS
jgi:hypothetical protein